MLLLFTFSCFLLGWGEGAAESLEQEADLLRGVKVVPNLTTTIHVIDSTTDYS